MGKVFTVDLDDLTIIANATLVWINPSATDVGIEILRWWAGQSGSATAGQIAIRAFTQVSVFPTVVSVEPSLHDHGDVISKIVGATNGAAGTCGVNASNNGAGIQTPGVTRGGSNIVGVEWLSTPDEWVKLPRGLTAGFGIRVIGTPSSVTSWHAGITFREI